MLSAEDNELLCRVEGDAPMGQLMRRHWIPACMSEEVAERTALRFECASWASTWWRFATAWARLRGGRRTLPTDARRLRSGATRSAGLRCLYHGWKIDVEGMSSIGRPSSTKRSQPRTVSKRHIPAARQAALSGYGWARSDACDSSRRRGRRPPSGPASSRCIACHWAQVLEGAGDSAHPARATTRRTHATGRRPSAERDLERVASARRPTGAATPVQRTDFGFRYVAIRHPIKDAGTHDLPAHPRCRGTIHPC